ncbi:hypothetical protein OROHE_012908 [Orobanche hederae]
MLGGGNEGSKVEEKSDGRKVYSRRSIKELENSNLTNDLLRDQAIVSEGLNSTKSLRGSAFDVGLDNFSSPRRDGLVVNGGFLRHENKIRIGLSMKSKHDVLELRRKLEAERDMVWSLMSRIEANEAQNNGGLRFFNRDGDKVAVGMGSPQTLNRKASTGDVEKEKRTPKANKFSRNSEFLLGKYKIAPAECNKKLKSKGGGSGLGMENFPNQVFKSCNALLERLMKHKHAWVFNKPVDAVALGLHDYFDIIKNPMDLGTVKNRLTQFWYKSPVEFAEDVRLTFCNAMTYNSKGLDVYVMAEQLSKMFEDKWAPVEAELKFDVGLPAPTTPNPPLPHSRAQLDMKKTTDISEAMACSIDPKRKTMGIAQSSKVSVLKKPKVKDPDKREMTYDEKQKLSVNLQNLPSEKLENIVQIIRKKNSSVSHQDDEIEFDIDSIDTETLWELDRFITNYIKSLSKNKRKAEIIHQLVTGPEQNTQEKITPSVVTETPKEIRTDEERVVSPPVKIEEPRRDGTNEGASQSSSSSALGSSFTDSVVGSSSADGSDGTNN